jgi:hypothetical protein
LQQKRRDESVTMRVLFGWRGGSAAWSVDWRYGTSPRTPPAASSKAVSKRPARRPTLRSSLVYAASKEIPNRFQLCQTISKAARKLHLASTPTQSTINRVLLELADQPAI